MDDPVVVPVQCLPGTEIEDSATEKSTGQCALRRPVAFLEACDHEIEVAIASILVTVADQGRRLADAGVLRHAKITPKTTLICVEDCLMRSQISRSWSSTKASLGKLFPLRPRVMTDRPRDFIRYVEDIFRQQGLRSNVLIMSGRFPEPAVVRRQIIEGVLAIVRMDTSGFMRGKVSVQIFDRRGGANNVQFNGLSSPRWMNSVD